MNAVDESRRAGRLRILQVFEPGVDGVFRHVEGLVDYLLANGVQVALAYSSVRSSDRLSRVVGRVKSRGFPVVDLRVGNAPSVADAPAMFRLVRLMHEFQPTVIHAHSSKAGGLCRILKLLGLSGAVFYTPNAYYSMGPKGKSREVFKWIERGLGRVGTTINVSLDEQEYAGSVLRIPAHRRLRIGNAVDTDVFRPGSPEEKLAWRVKLGLPSHKVILGTVGRFSYQKDPLTLYRAAREAVKVCPDLFIAHLGQGEMMADVNEENRVADFTNCAVLPYMSDTSGFYKALDGFVMTSRYEGLSFAILEALAADLPLILSDVMGNREFIALGLTHLWSAEMEDVEGFARAMTLWYEGKRQGLPEAINHRRIAECRYSFGRCYGELLLRYHQYGESAVWQDSLEMMSPCSSVSSARPNPSVLIVVEPGIDGVFRHCEGLIELAHARQIPVHLAYSSRRSSPALKLLVQRVAERGGWVMDLGVSNLPSPLDVVAFSRLLLMVRELSPDVIHAHSSKAGALARAVAAVVRHPRVFYSPHAYYGMSKPRTLKVRFFNWIEHLLGRVGRTIAVSRDEARFGEQQLGVPSERITVVHNPVDPERFSPGSADQRRRAREQLKIPENAVVVATIGRMAWQKDPETAYAAMAPICRENPDVVFVHLGWGKWKEYLLGFAEKHGIARQLISLHYTDDPRAFYHAVDAVLITSRYEAGWPLVALEAMACNLPVIASTCLGMSDIGQAGLSHVSPFKPEDAPGCTAAIATWLKTHRTGPQTPCHRAFTLQRLTPPTLLRRHPRPRPRPPARHRQPLRLEDSPATRRTPLRPHAPDACSGRNTPCTLSMSLPSPSPLVADCDRLG